MDSMAGTSTPAARQSALRLLVTDTCVLVTMFRYLPWIFLPFKTVDKSAEFYMNTKGTRDMILQMWLFLSQLGLLLLGPFAMLVLPGGIFIIVAALCCLGVYAISIPLQGPRIVYSQLDDAALLAAKDFEKERWLYVNGCITSHQGLQNNVNRLAATFGRPVTGIHNQTYGLIADLIECLIQRCLSYNTADVRVAYDHIKACVADPAVTKVVLIAHSQGGIIVSLVLDRLFTDLPTEILSKLEIYTFGSAASHFNNPCLSLSSPFSLSSCSPTTCRNHAITHIEHYVNELDMIPRWGVLHNILSVLSNRYSGKVFVRMGATGHMFNQHYMNPMFPLSPALSSEFLDQVVNVDKEAATRREAEAVREAGVLRREEGGGGVWGERVEFGNGEVVPVETIVKEEIKAGGLSAMGINFVGEGMGERGRTVRQLSRLWRYTGGGVPGASGVV